MTTGGTAKSHTAEIPEDVLRAVENNPWSNESQGYLKAAYAAAGDHMTAWKILRTENPLWHIQGIISTATLFFALAYPVGRALNLGGAPYEPIVEALIFEVAALVVSTFSLIALFTRKKKLKSAAALGLFSLYTYFITYYLIEGIENWFQFITTVAFTMMSGVLYIRWNLPK